MHLLVSLLRGRGGVGFAELQHGEAKALVTVLVCLMWSLPVPVPTRPARWGRVLPGPFVRIADARCPPCPLLAAACGSAAPPWL